ncbi:hypothetical protein QBC43DRAFT_332230 [Cladorrhinum sp. PSN259]|nr:hypothetical protein QBC43DRAFT_332230 [Cladorrhinum sp. PSN259]
MSASNYEKAIDRAAEDIDDKAILAQVNFWIKEFELGRAKNWASNSALRKVERIVDYMIAQYNDTGIIHKELLSHEEILALRYYSPNGDLSPKIVSGLLELDLAPWMSHKTLGTVAPTPKNLEDIEARIESVINNKGLATQESVDTIAKKLEKNKKISEELGRVKDSLDQHCKETIEQQLKPLLGSIAEVGTIKSEVEGIQKTLQDHQTQIKDKIEKLEKELSSKGPNAKDNRSGPPHDSSERMPAPSTPASQQHHSNQSENYHVQGRFTTSSPPLQNDHSQPRKEAESNTKRQAPTGGFNTVSDILKTKKLRK